MAARKEMYSELRRVLPAQLPAFLRGKRWFGGKARVIRSVDIVDLIPVITGDLEAAILMTRVSYSGDPEDLYAIPLAFADDGNTPPGEESDVLVVDDPEAGRRIFLRDGLKHEQFLRLLLRAIEEGSALRGERGELRASRTSTFALHCGDFLSALEPKPIGTEQSNSSIIYGDRLILKFFRRVEEGVNPDLELGLFLTEKANFPHIPQIAGSLEYVASDGRRMTQGILQRFVPNVSDAWRYTVSRASRFLDDVLATPRNSGSGKSTRESRHDELPDSTRQSLDEYLRSAALLGKRTAQLHVALASRSEELAFAPEPFDSSFRQDIRDSFRTMTAKVLGILRGKAGDLPSELRRDARNVAGREKEIEERCDEALHGQIEAMRIRIHGDYHLGQVLYTGTDFVIIDFEGEPARSLAERRTKRSPLQDVAGMLRSFQYAAFAPLLGAAGDKPALRGDMVHLQGWADWWSARVAERFLANYFATSRQAVYLPQDEEQRRTLLKFHLLEKAIYELGYELNNRPDWVGIPLAGILTLLPS